MITLSDRNLPNIFQQLSLCFVRISHALYLIEAEKCIESLLKWATRKHIPLPSYQYSLNRYRVYLQVYAHRYPLALEVAYWIRSVQTTVFPSTTHYPKGYARKFLLS